MTTTSMEKNTMKYIAFILAISFTPLAYSDDYEAESLIKYRHDTMTAIKGHNNAIKAIVKGKVPYDNHFDVHLSSLEALFNQIDSLFPEGSDFGETHAKDEIWDNPEKFSKTVEKAKQALAEFKKIAKQGNKKATGKAFKEFGKASCGSCHKSFKKKDHDH